MGKKLGPRCLYSGPAQPRKLLRPSRRRREGRGTAADSSRSPWWRE